MVVLFYLTITIVPNVKYTGPCAFHPNRLPQSSVTRVSMAHNELPDYKALFDEERRNRRQGEEQTKHAEEQRQQEADLRTQAEEQRQYEAELRKQAGEQTRPTTFDEYIVACHTLLSAPSQVAQPSRSTKVSIPTPTGKYCPS